MVVTMCVMIAERNYFGDREEVVRMVMRNYGDVNIDEKMFNVVRTVRNVGGDGGDEHGKDELKEKR